MWGRPDNLDPDRSPDAAAVVAEWCHRWRGAAPSPMPDVGDLWDLAAWADHAEELRTEMAELLGPLEGGDRTGLAPGFVTSAAVLRHLQADPLLPAELLPTDWPATTCAATTTATTMPTGRAHRLVQRLATRP